MFEEIAVELALYLERKRMYFSRLYFLSDDQLLDVLSHTKSPEKVQPYLRCLFEGLYKVRSPNTSHRFGLDARACFRIYHHLSVLY